VELAELGETAARLEKAVSEPGQMTLSELEELVTTTLHFSASLSAKAQRQQQAIASLRASLDAERASAEESRQLAENLRSIAKEQLEAVKFVITEDAKQQANQAFIYGAVASFPIGVLASVAGAFLYQRFLKRPSLQHRRREQHELAEQGLPADAEDGAAEG
jgi:hypothetical protein